ncbi:hypothetical protein GPECTOR_27g686 [Gonium pectorale]|uniref:Uncharacterized protein n=1 Tax=Gonium pectorale TaxID=33097 RepID=A0A150GFY8_GONPE|nr:hypothetical protein GPECTOR_27g686 [Gonium pectorale]|eukprot:KXZ48515.1 hypothetical protein GPECTOR_27g686 [Gonium pectorale]
MGGETSKPASPGLSRDRNPRLSRRSNEGYERRVVANSQIILSYHSVETGARDVGGDGSVVAIKRYLEAHGYSVFVSDSALVGEDNGGQNSQKWGEGMQEAVLRCSVFIALCSKSYDMLERALHDNQLADKDSVPPILPIWHSGPAPPPPAVASPTLLPAVPAGPKPLADCDFGECMQQLLARLRDARVLPLRPPSRDLLRSVSQPTQQQKAAAASAAGGGGTSGGGAYVARAEATLLEPTRSQPVPTGTSVSASGEAPGAAGGGAGGGGGVVRVELAPEIQPSGGSQSRLTPRMSPGGSRVQHLPLSSPATGLPITEALKVRLLDASDKGDVATVARLLVHVKDPKELVNSTRGGKSGATPLHWAAEHGHTAVLEVLLRAGADHAARTERWWTPLHYAAYFGHVGAAEGLLAAGADLAAKTQLGHTPLHIAAQKGHTAILEELLRSGADVAAKTKEGWTALHIAAHNGHTAVVELLLKEGAQVGDTNQDGATALHVGAYPGHLATVEALLRAGAEVDARQQLGSATPLLLAAEYGHTEVAEALLRAGADPKVKNEALLPGL